MQRASYPAIVSHLYPLSLGAVYRAAHDVIAEEDWTVTRDVHPPFMAEAPSGAPVSQAVAEDQAVIEALALKSVMTQVAERDGDRNGSRRAAERG